MKFEQLLQIYWSRGFLYGGKSRKFDVDLKTFFEESFGLSEFAKKKFVKRFEINHFLYKKDESFIVLPLDRRKIMNMYLSQIISINNEITELVKYNLIRLFLIKTFRGRCFALKKPSRAQRTRSNAATAFRENKVIPNFISQVLKFNAPLRKKVSLNLKLIKKKTRAPRPKIKMIFTKKKKNLWF